MKDFKARSITIGQITSHYDQQDSLQVIAFSS